MPSYDIFSFSQTKKKGGIKYEEIEMVERYLYGNIISFFYTNALNKIIASQETESFKVKS